LAPAAEAVGNFAWRLPKAWKATRRIKRHDFKRGFVWVDPISQAATVHHLWEMDGRSQEVHGIAGLATVHRASIKELMFNPPRDSFTGVPSTMKYRPDIDGLRAVAVLPVLFYHAGVPGFPGGFVGVDIFFVISGFVITARLKEDLVRSTFSILDFYERRVRRIFPALLFVFALTWLASLVLLLPSEMVDFSRSLAAAGYFSSNFYFWKGSGYFDTASALRPLLHTWSLAVEEQFYIFMPIAMYLGYRFLNSRWKLLFWPAAVASLILSEAVGKTAPAASFFLLPTRAWELLLGALLILTPPPRIPTRFGQVGAATGLVMIAYSVFLFNETTPFPGLNALYPCLGSALLIYFNTERVTLIGRVLSLGPMVQVGRISYSLYLVHWPMIVMSHYYLIRSPQGLEVIGVILASFALAIFSFRFVETPFRKPKHETSRTRVLSLAIASLAATFVVGSVGALLNGFPSRFPDYHEENVAGFGGWQIGACFLSPGEPIAQWDRGRCTITTGHGENLLLWGDSFAAHYAPGIVINKDNIDANVIQYTSAGCPPILSYYSYKIPLCSQFNAHALDLIKDYDVKTVVLSARWDLLAHRGTADLHETIAKVRALGADVFVIGEPPEFGLDVQSLGYRLRDVPPIDGSSSWKIANFNPAIDDGLRAQAADAVLIEPIKELCEGDMCPYRINGSFVYTDYGHFSAEGSDYAVKKYFPRLVKQTIETGSRAAAARSQ
jgi:peptidoglycan/LPS O-acetylase OafA/YrhL